MSKLMKTALYFVVTLFLLGIFSGMLPSNASSAPLDEKPSDLFGIYTATVDGENMKLLLANSWQEMSHPRVSPNEEWITFTRYNQKDENGIAEEAKGYLETEIMLMRADGTDVKTIVPAKQDAMNANSSWTPDGCHLLYVTTNTPNRMPAIAKVNIYTKEIIYLPTPKNLLVSDPNQVGDYICFPGRINNNSQQHIWRMKYDGTEVSLVTNTHVEQRHPETQFILGDYDPHLSPDGTKLTTMRYFGGTEWHVIVADVETGKELDLTDGIQSTQKIFADTVATWSPSGKQLLFRHIELPNIPKIGLYTITPDGKERTQIALPEGYFFGTISSYFPKNSSTKENKIIFHARKDDRF